MIIKLLLSLVVTLVFLCGIGVFLIKSGALEISASVLEARYKLPTSQFADIDGIRVHYVDEGPAGGSADVVVLLHASGMSLRSWDGMAAALSPHYRVIRLDFPSLGLTGPDPKERYSIELNIALVDQLTHRLGVERFAVVGTSTGAVTAFRYAALHPEKVTRLILINSAGMPRIPTTDPNRERGSALSRWIQSYYKSPGDYYNGLIAGFPSKPPPPGLAQMLYDMNRRTGREREGAIFLRNFRTGDPEATLGQVRAPTLILWGMKNVAVMHLEANVIELWLTGAPSMVKKYPDLGHYPYLEQPEAVEADVANFLSGSIDGELRVTQRVVPTGAVVSR